MSPEKYMRFSLYPDIVIVQLFKQGRMCFSSQYGWQDERLPQLLVNPFKLIRQIRMYPHGVLLRRLYVCVRGSGGGDCGPEYERHCLCADEGIRNMNMLLAGICPQV